MPAQGNGVALEDARLWVEKAKLDVKITQRRVEVTGGKGGGERKETVQRSTCAPMVIRQNRREP